MTGVIYCRVSSKEQIEGTSLDSQEAACREYARAHRIEILKIFVGRGESAKFADRPELIELLDWCRVNKGSVQAILVWKLDRLARNVADHFNIKATLLKYGIRVLSVTEPIDANPEGKLLETILAGFAQFDNDIRAMRTVQGMKRKLQDGIFPFKPPLGYRSVRTGDQKKNAPDVPHPPLFGLIQKAWRLLATGAYTKAEVRRIMASWGIVTKNGKPLPPQSIDDLFRNKYYAGTLANPWTGEENLGAHIPMVTHEEFDQVQRVLAKRSRSMTHHHDRPEFPLRGIVRCPSCIYPMTASFSRGRHGARYGYYHCSYRECGNPRRFRDSVIHDEFDVFLESVSPKPELIDTLREAIIEEAERRDQDERSNAERRKTRAKRLSEQLKELIRMRTQGLLTDDEFLAERKSLATEQVDIEKTARKAFTAHEVRANLEQITGHICNIRSLWNRLDASQRRGFERCLLPVGFVAGAIRNAEIGLLFRLMGDFDSDNSTAVALSGETWNRLIEEIRAFARLFRDEDTQKLTA